MLTIEKRETIMSKKKINPKNLAILSASSIVLSCVFGMSVSYITEGDTGWIIAITNLFSSIYLLCAVNSRIGMELGSDSATVIAGNWSKKAFGREIPVNAGDKKTSVFMSVLALTGGNTSQSESVVELETLSIWHSGNNHTIIMADVEEFVFAAWRRQRQSKSGFSRRYWTEQRRPIITTLEYKLRMKILTNIEGLIINRSEYRSGKITLSPNETIKKIKAAY